MQTENMVPFTNNIWGFEHSRHGRCEYGKAIKTTVRLKHSAFMLFKGSWDEERLYSSL